MSVDFYCRVFVRIFTSQLKCKETITKLSLVHSCTSCDSLSFQALGRVIKNGNSVKYQLNSPSLKPNCEHCGGTHRTGGPIWTAPIHDQNFVSRLKATLPKGSPLNTQRRMEGILTMIEEELPDAPLYVVFDQMLSRVRMPCFRMKEFTSAILNAGYRVSPTHAAKNGIKTDAPFSLLWEIIRAREKLYPINMFRIPNDHIAHLLLSDKPPSASELNSPKPPPDPKKISFEIHPGATFESSKLLRFQHNPKQHWGPKSRSVTSIFHLDLPEKSKSKQGFREDRRKRKREQECASENGEKD
ncbi:UNVERIFIED_CONTAM: hypothetical protein GTU68_003200 [Idotea baltica]|nr:hypothetical protein [Idotea baltica]